MMWMRYMMYVFPYWRMAPEDRFAVWGYGEVGKAYVRQWKERPVGELAAVVDQRAEDAGNPLVHAPAYLRKHPEITKVLIAVANKRVTGEILKQLRAWGVEEERIVTGVPYELHRVPVPDKWLRLPPCTYLDALQEQLRLFRVRRGGRFTRVGNTNDGGYVMLDDFQEEGIAYSFGICDDVTWDRAMAERGYEVYMYDHTINGLPEEHPAFHFFRKGIAGETCRAELDTLEHYIHANHHEAEQHMILKMDVEGAEWESLLACPEEVLQSFDQIVLELHDLILHPDAQGEGILRTLAKLNETHALVHLHANNYSNEYQIDGRIFADVVEVTYARRAIYDCEPGGEAYTEWDAPCCPMLPEVHLS